MANLHKQLTKQSLFIFKCSFKIGCMTLKLVVVTDIMGAVVFLLFKLAYSLLISLVKAFSVSFPNVMSSIPVWTPMACTQ